MNIKWNRKSKLCSKKANSALTKTRKAAKCNSVFLRTTTLPAEIPAARCSTARANLSDWLSTVTGTLEQRHYFHTGFDPLYRRRHPLCTLHHRPMGQGGTSYPRNRCTIIFVPNPLSSRTVFSILRMVRLCYQPHALQIFNISFCETKLYYWILNYKFANSL